MPDDAVKYTGLVIVKQLVSKKRGLNDFLTNPDLTEIIALTVDARVQNTFNNKVTADCLDNSVEEFVFAEKFITGTHEDPGG